MASAVIFWPTNTSPSSVQSVETAKDLSETEVNLMTDTPDDKPKPKRRPLPLTETLVLDIVDYLLENDGYGYGCRTPSF